MNLSFPADQGPRGADTHLLETKAGPALMAETCTERWNPGPLHPPKGSIEKLNFKSDSHSSPWEGPSSTCTCPTTQIKMVLKFFPPADNSASIKQAFSLGTHSAPPAVGGQSPALSLSGTKDSCSHRSTVDGQGVYVCRGRPRAISPWLCLDLR